MNYAKIEVNKRVNNLLDYLKKPLHSPKSSYIFGCKLRLPPLHANCNPNAVSVQCMQIAIRALVPYVVGGIVLYVGCTLPFLWE